MAILEAHHVVKTFGTFTAVDNLSLALGEGEILGLLGPNGAGKTTTIQMLLGVLLPTSGTIRVFDKELDTHRQEILEKVNFSSTYTNLPWTLTVEENLTYTSYLYDIPDRARKVQEVLSVFKLEELRRQELSTLSAGQLTRTNLAKAFINDPKILLLDEPTASLDPEIAAYIRDYILTQRRERGVSILFTSHNMPEVEEVCDRVLFINHGTIIADDKPANLARSLDFCRVQLMLSDRDAALLSSYCESTGKKLLSDSHGATVEMKERDLALFLKEITDRKIHFSEISIDKPTLEDYFLHMAKQKKSPITMDTII